MDTGEILSGIGKVFRCWESSCGCWEHPVVTVLRKLLWKVARLLGYVEDALGVLGKSYMGTGTNVMGGTGKVFVGTGTINSYGCWERF